ncbi:MAG: hypothetical protein OXG61_02360, partial [Chloroflexi bacterium]|nr:hypothetical protein [Chloroflexota bacterium]
MSDELKFARSRPDVSLTTALDETAIASLNERFEAATPEEIVRWAVDTFGDGLSVGASFGGPTG